MSDKVQEPEVKESPVLEQPEPTGKETPQPAPDPMESARQVLETLNKLGIESEDPESAAAKLQNMHYASQQAGRYANDLGAERQKVQALEQRLAALEARRTQQQPAQDDFEAIYGEQRPPSLRPEDVRNVMREEIGNYIQMQNQATQQQLQEYAGIRGDSEYGMMEDLFNKHIANPKVQMAMQTRQTNLSKEYDRVKTTFYKNLAKQSRDALQNLLNRTNQAAAAPPHMEQSSSQTQGIPQRPGVKDELYDMAKKSMGTDDDLDAMLRTMLPDDDQFLFQAEEVREGRFNKNRP